MRDFPGTPGTPTGLVLRISQCVFAAGSISYMVTSGGFFSYTAFCYLIAAMGLQVIWSLGLALLDTFALLRNKALRSAVLVSLFVVGDWVTATLSLAAASSAGGITVLYFSDLGHCSFAEECWRYQLSVALAFLCWIAIATSSLTTLWLLASG
ncbi:PREDICTED: CASP-like protein 5B3 [Tarenaya hassleriana]|uniref:CASP-like protein 5B3 n=1 Tax=Tarenaya hassleriana TaxID=28532 RepID=UPI00053C9EF7|nr:PREDICTED: CASP-like protein 5B3 [Tarenaya hassleriana]